MRDDRWTSDFNAHLAACWPVGMTVRLQIGSIGRASGIIIEHAPPPGGGSGLLLHIRMTEDKGEYCHVGDVRVHGVGMSGGDALSGPAMIAPA